MLKFISTTVILCLISSESFAYLGPGIGGGVVAATIGIIVAIFAALFSLIWIPVKEYLKKEKKEKKNNKINLINHILLIGSSVFIYELIKYLKLIEIIRSNLKIYRKIIKLFRYKNVSDFRKEKLILNYSKILFITSIKLIAILVSIFIFFIFLNLFFNSYLNFLISILAIIELSVIFIIYHLIRKKIYAKI